MRLAANRKALLSIEAMLSLLVLLFALTALLVTSDARRPAYGRLYEYQLLEDVMEIAMRNPELLHDDGKVGAIGAELGYCIEIGGAGTRCNCGNDAVSTTRIVPDGDGFERISARLCKELR